jgi:pyruvate dehydrogenase E2 component (dihydrolipoamide acetyltransferase)
MTTDFFIPKLEQTEEVTIVNWLVEDGAEINEGDEIVEIETDKAVVPVPANAAGYLRIGAYKAGDIVSTLTVIATIGGQDEAFAPGSDETGSQTVPAAEPVAATAAQLDPPSAAAEAESEAPATGSKPRATPVAQKMATDLGVDLQTVTGSGDHGKITKVDVRQAALPEKAPEPTPVPQPKAPSAVAIPDPSAPAEDVLERVPLKSIRGVISRRMAESVHTTARVTLVTEVDATELVILREQLKARFTEPWGFAPGYNDLLAIMVANALRQFPYMNARLSAEGDAIEYVKPINIGMAVDTDRGLMVPVIRDVDKLGLQDFGSTFRELVNRARSGKSKLEDLSGGTFTITSLGIYRVEAFTPVINLPQAAILGLGRIKEKPVVKDGEIVARKILTLSLVFDHRLTDGAPAARFLDYICELIEEPYLLFLTKR